jgi:hypothetical protein
MLVSLDHRKQVGNLRSCRRTIRAIRDSASWTNKLVIERADVDLLFRPDVDSIANHARTDFTFELLARDEILLSVLEHHSNLVHWQTLAKQTGILLRFLPITRTAFAQCKTSQIPRLPFTPRGFRLPRSLLKFYALAT